MATVRKPSLHRDSFPTFYSTGGRAAVPAGLRLQLDPDDLEEDALRRAGLRLVAGIDEVGRGCLAGPVVAGAVILRPGWTCPGLRDSKMLEAPERERLAQCIRDGAIAWAVAAVEASLIDRINILQATLLASMLAAARLPVRPDALITDSLLLPDIGLPQRVLIDADRRCLSVAAASVVAKVYRDALMVEYDVRYPGYGFAEHKGYAAPDHRAAIESLGVTPIHRRTFGSCIEAPEAEQTELWPA
ncbi:MAG TPA: ribonuclease HII [Candidatus Baltobacteraceae bacterium]|nr:ribonuclease HII [Candidatus Baltobacteraceae bacterium]